MAFCAHRNRLLRMQNVIGVGVGDKRVGGRPTGKKAICVLVREKKPLSELPATHAIPERIDDHHTDVIEIGHIKLLANTERMRPAAPGCSIGHYLITAGTFGCVVRDKNRGRRLILSNNHVLANITDGQDGRARVGDPIYQPGVYDLGTPDDTIAHLERWVPIYRIDRAPTCPIAMALDNIANSILKTIRPNYSVRLSRSTTVENLVDAAVARPVSDSVITDSILEIGVPRGLASPFLGMKVQKNGRTSGLTTGEIMVVGATLRISMGDVGEAMFSDQIVTTPMGQPGDSGSLVLDEQKRAVGLLSAGSEKATVCSLISNVLNLLAVSLVTE